MTWDAVATNSRRRVDRDGTSIGPSAARDGRPDRSFSATSTKAAPVLFSARAGITRCAIA
jgi:hypothetical protein